MDEATRVGPWEILGHLSGGAMGAISRARHVETGEVAALKRVGMPVRVQLASIRREIRALQAIEHPNVVRILDHGDAPHPWYAMELVDGTTLSDAMRDVPIPERWQLFLPTLCNVCDGLSALHRKGIVHRDLKPANVMVRAETGDAVLVDLGLATVSGAGAGREQLYKRSEVAGTPHYIAPEQVEQRPVDPRTDLYALGCILFQLLTGGPPFPAPLPIVGMLNHINMMPSFEDRVAQWAPPRLRELVLALLEKKPQNRPGYAVDVKRELRAIAGLGDDRTDVAADTTYLYRPRLHGRHDARETLRSIGDAFPEEGKLLLIRGAGGAGRSSLAVEAIRNLPHDGERSLEVLIAESPPDFATRSSFETLRNAFEEICDWCIERGPARTRELLGPDGPHLERFFERIGTLPGVDGAPPPVDGVDFEDRMCRAVSGVLTRFSQVRPLAVVLDDIDDADVMTRRWLASMAWNPIWRENPVVLVVTGRYGDFLLDALADLPGAEKVRVGPLPDDAVAAMVRDMIAVDELPDEFVRALMERSEGYPGRVANWLREAVRREVLTRRGGDWSFYGRSLDDERVRDTMTIDAPLDEIIRQRVKRMPEDLRSALTLAACVGTTVPVDLYEELRDSFEGLDRLMAEGVLEEVGRGDVGFTDERFAEFALELAADEERRRAHELIAATLRGMREIDEEELLEQLLASGDEEDALQLLFESARRHVEHADYALAERALERAATIRELPPPLADLRVLVAFERGETADALRRRRTANRPSKSGLGLEVDGLVAETKDDRVAAIDAYSAAERAYAAQGSATGQHRCLIRLGQVWRRRGRPEVAVDVFEKTIAKAAACGDRRREALACLELAETLAQDDRDEALRHFAEAESLFRGLDDVDGAAQTLLARGVLLLRSGATEAAVGALRVAYSASWNAGNERRAATALVRLAEALVEAQHLDAAAETAGHAIPTLERLQSSELDTARRIAGQI